MASCLVMLGCSAEVDPANPWGALAQTIVYGADTRTEFFDAPSHVQATMAESAVVLMPRQAIDSATGQLAASLPTWRESAGLCAGEPFADQPVAASCSGVLVDWDLILTAGHCAQFAPAEVVAVFGYYYTAPGQLHLGDSDVLGIEEIVTAERDSAGAEPRLDYALLRLTEPARPPRKPAAVYLRRPNLEPEESIYSIGAEGGAPLKADIQGEVFDPRPDTVDYFVASTDTSGGSSGAGAFDSRSGLLGVLARGGVDFAESEAGCLTTAREETPRSASEQYTYAFRLVQAYCSGGGVSSLCRSDCTEPCRALPPPASDGCAVVAPALRPTAANGLLAVALLAVLRRFRQSSACAPAAAAERTGRARPS